ncbi:hypothetical protein QX776_05825 [Alteromonadaceae bacterium BrNp21-10]|nr:hypothetical protein [Alteromonadaceae bacterium BrNp21-10]
MKNSRFIIVLLCGLLYACASANLSIEVDLYDEDPQLTLPPSPALHLELLTQAQVLQLEAEKQHRNSVQWMAEVKNIYTSIWYSAGGATKEEGISKAHPISLIETSIDRLIGEEEARIKGLALEVENLSKKVNGYNTKYSNAINEAKKYYQKTCSNSPAAIDKNCLKPKVTSMAENKDSNIPNLPYEQSCRIRQTKYHNNERRCTEPEIAENQASIIINQQRYIQIQLAGNPQLISDQQHIQQQLNRVIAAFDAYQSTPTLKIDWTSLEVLLEAKLIQAATNTLEQQRLRRLISNAQERIQTLNEAVRSHSSIIAQRGIERKAEINAVKSQQITVNFTGFNRAMPLAGSIREILSEQAKNTSGLYDLIDRLQDVGDPIWRIVTDPNNEYHWNKRVSKTFVKANGDTSMVIVRDTPLHFRAHHAQNNPSALIRGQLEIARAIGDVALSIAGVNSELPASSSQTSSSETIVDPTSQTDLSINFLARQQTLDKKQQALVAMVHTLRNLKQRIEQINPKENEKITQLRNEIQGILKGFQLSFAGDISND